MNNNYYDLYFTVMKNKDDKEIVNYDDYENDYNNFKDFITRNLYIGRKNDNVRLKQREMRSQINHFK